MNTNNNLSPIPKNLQTKEAEACFAPALALVPELAEIVRSFRDANRCIQYNDQIECFSQTSNLIEEKLLANASSDAQLYLGCLLKAYMYALTRAASPRHLEDDIRSFIQGNYQIKGEAPINDVHIPGYPYGVLEGDNIIATSRANHLAMWKIVECELARQYHNPELARRFAASTARLLAGRPTTSEPEAVYTITLSHFVESIIEHDCNPFAKARIFEFAGQASALTHNNDRKCALVRSRFIDLFKSYQDYTPNGSGCAKECDQGFVSLSQPGDFFQSIQKWSGKEKCDYVIASNVFCLGASKFDSLSHKQKINENIRNILPHLANIVKDNGKIIISNTARDGIGFDSRKFDFDDWKQWGIKLYTSPEATFPFINVNPLAVECVRPDLFVFERKHMLRPEVAVTHEEWAHDQSLQAQRREHPHTTSSLSFLQKELSRKGDDGNHALSGGWETGF